MSATREGMPQPRRAPRLDTAHAGPVVAARPAVHDGAPTAPLQAPWGQPRGAQQQGWQAQSGGRRQQWASHPCCA
eukprot:11086107-Alexandrium_andersonii.AAC.1